MSKFPRVAIPLLCALALGPGGRADPKAGPAPALSPELAALLAQRSQWSATVAAEGAYGYKDNLLLSATGREASPFARGGVEALVLRLGADRLEFSGFMQAEATRYFAGETVDDDAKAWLHTELAYGFLDTLKVSAPVTGYYYDQVFDVSDTEVERQIAALKVRGAMFGPTLRWDFHPRGWLEAQAVGERKLYDDGANDSRIGEGALRLGWTLGARVEARIGVAERWRAFDSRAQFNAAGRELAGTELKIHEREGELRLDVGWDEAGRWETTTRVGMLRYADNGSGYFDYDEGRVAHEVEWRTDAWLVRLEGAARRIEFRVQTVGLGIDPPGRIKEEYLAALRVERTLSPRWTVFGSYAWERSRSNETIAAYRVNEGLLGVRWNWEK